MRPTTFICHAPSLLFPLLLAPLLTALAAGVEIHVAPAGRDGAAGTRTAPVATLAAAQALARPHAGREPVTVVLADGVYHLPAPLVFRAEDSGSGKFPVVWQAANEGKAVVSGGMKLAANWKPWRNGIRVTATPPGLEIDQLFINGRRQHMARYPNYDPAKTTAAYQGHAADAVSKERAARWADPAGGFIHAMHAARWGGYHYRITGKKPDGSPAYEGGWQNNRQMGMHPQQRMVENIFEELDAPGEWFHDRRQNQLYYFPPPGSDASHAVVEIVRLARLFDLRGDAAAPVAHLTFRGLVFRHTARTFMDTREPLLRSDWTICRSGAVTLTGTRSITLQDCEFDQPGGNAVFVDKFNRNTLIQGCHIHDTGASGVCFVGDPAAVRDPLFEYTQTRDLAKIDLTPGPRSDAYPADCAVRDCLIHGIGRVERQAAAVQIAMSARITLTDLSIYDCSRAGINIGDGCWGGHLIDRCDVFDTVLETHDHGSFNSWGRDRYWCSNHRAKSEPFVNRNPRLPFLDAVETTTIRHSRWRCDHGWDIDLDDGSSNYEIHHNLLLSGGLKLREGYGRKAHHNLVINNGLHPHVWFDRSGDSVSHNILMRPHAPIGQPPGWEAASDRNFLTEKSALDACRAMGADARSVLTEDPFVAPAAGDFRIKPGTAAWQAGFRNLRMDAYGVKKPALRSIARTPVIPPLLRARGSTAAEPDRYWLGARLHSLTGEEFSAFGTRREDGGVQIATLPVTAPAATTGLLLNDLVQRVNGTPTPDVPAFLQAVLAAGSGEIALTGVRHQQPFTLKVAAPPVVLLREQARSAEAFTQLRPAPSPSLTVSSRPATAANNAPPAALLDGRLAADYGAVFENGRQGAYKLDLGTARPVRAVRVWTHNQGGNRGTQSFTAYGSGEAADPGWNPADAHRFQPIGSVHAAAPDQAFLGTALQTGGSTPLGVFRWILIVPSPLNPIGENSAFQEIAVDAP